VVMRVRVLSNGALYLTDVEGECVDMVIKSGTIKRCYDCFPWFV